MTRRPKNVESWILVQIQVTIGTQVHDTFFFAKPVKLTCLPSDYVFGRKLRTERSRLQIPVQETIWTFKYSCLLCNCIIVIWKDPHKMNEKEAEDLEWFFRRNLFSMQRLALALAFVKYGVKKLQLRFCVHLLMPFQQQQQQPWRQQLNNKNNNNATWIKKEKNLVLFFNLSGL